MDVGVKAMNDSTGIKALQFAVALSLWFSQATFIFAQQQPGNFKSVPSKGGELLVRIDGNLRNFSMLQSGVDEGRYRIKPLFQTVSTARNQGKDVVWLVATPSEPSESSNSWDEAHALANRLREGKVRGAFLSTESIYVEVNEKNEVPYAGMPGEKPDKAWPHLPVFAWHLDEKYTQLAKARTSPGTSGCVPRLTILDTGIFPSHITTPRNRRKDLEKNLVEGSGDATDPGVDGLLNNPGHGTATIAILAGGRVKMQGFDGDLGGAPDAEIVAVRIANSVLHFWSKEMAEGIDYAISLPRQPNTDYCETISISMGGVASRAWAYTVNQAYERGIFIAAAAGNNFGDFPTRYTVYPSRFHRVVTVTGATANYTPYRTDKNPGASGMQGNYGPESVMVKAIAAFTPNVPWARWNSPNIIDTHGAGTSSATPQVAAASALWMQAHGSNYQGWQRVEATRWALFTSADKSRPESTTYFGNGLLRAADALGKVPDKSVLRKRPEDDVVFPFWRILLGLREPQEGEEKMYEVEALNIAMRTPGLAPYLGDWPQAKAAGMTDANLYAAAKMIHDDKRASRALKTFLSVKVLGKK